MSGAGGGDHSVLEFLRSSGVDLIHPQLKSQINITILFLTWNQ